jgi:hypothetical protein
MAPVSMPDRYVAEMLMDRIAACKVYKGSKYTDRDPLDYYLKGADVVAIHPETKAKMLKFFTMLAEKGERETFKCIKKELVQGAK